MKRHIAKLKKMKACNEAVEWAKQYPNMQAAWNACDRGDWMAWYIGKQIKKTGSPKHRKLILAICDCAELTLKFVSKDEKRPAAAIRIARQWASQKNGITSDDVRVAANAANAPAARAVANAASAGHAAYVPAAAAAAATGEECASILREAFIL